MHFFNIQMGFSQLQHIYPNRNYSLYWWVVIPFFAHQLFGNFICKFFTYNYEVTVEFPCLGMGENLRYVGQQWGSAEIKKLLSFSCNFLLHFGFRLMPWLYCQKMGCKGLREVEHFMNSFWYCHQCQENQMVFCLSPGIISSPSKNH